MIETSNTFSITVLDWDDTLFPTTALRSAGVKQLAPYLLRVDALVLQLIEAALDVPNSCVLLLTNANLQWVYTAAEEFLPKVHALLQNAPRHLILASAQQKFDKSGQPLEKGSLAAAQEAVTWKAIKVHSLVPSLQAVISSYCASSIQVLSIGDSLPDLELAHLLAQLLYCQDERIIKTVAMKQHPTGAELVGELQSLCRAFETLASTRKSFHRNMFRQSPPQSRTASPQQLQLASTLAPVITDNALAPPDSPQHIENQAERSVHASITVVLERSVSQSCETSAVLAPQNKDEPDSGQSANAEDIKLFGDRHGNDLALHVHISASQASISTGRLSEPNHVKVYTQSSTCNSSRKFRRRRPKAWQRIA
jgi:hypothetical protein